MMMQYLYRMRKVAIDKVNQELNLIFLTLSNQYRRILIMAIGDRGRLSGGLESMIEPLAKEYSDVKFNRDTLRSHLSNLKFRWFMVDHDENGYWVLTDKGKKAYWLLKTCYKQWKCKG